MENFGNDVHAVIEQLKSDIELLENVANTRDEQWQNKWKAALDLLDPRNAEIDKLRAENEQLREVNNQTWCAYCEKKYPRTPDSMEQIREHIATCEKHPMRELEAEIGKLHDLIDFYQACGFTVIEHVEDNGKISKFVSHAGAEHYPPRPV